MNTPKVVVVGSSYSSCSALYYLEKYIAKARQSVDLIFLSDKSFYFIPEMLSQYLCESCSQGDFIQEIRSIGFFRPGIKYIQTEILEIDFNNKIIKAANGHINYNYLILAPEINQDFIGENIKYVDNVNSFSAKSPIDIIRIKNHIAKILELSSSEPVEELRKRLLTFNIIASNSQAVEYAFALSDFIKSQMSRKYPDLKNSLLKINLISEKNSLNLSNNPFYNSRIYYYLNKKGINVSLNSKITSFNEDRIEINNEDVLYSKTLIFLEEAVPPQLIKNLSLKKDELSNIAVDLYLNADGLDDVFVVGAFSRCLDLSERLTMTSDFYNEQAKLCASNVVARINNNSLKSLKPRLDIKFVFIGAKNSIFIVKDLCWDGFSTWVIHRLIFVWSLLGLKKKLTSFISLVLNITGLSDQYLLNINELRKEKQIMKT